MYEGIHGTGEQHVADSGHQEKRPERRESRRAPVRGVLPWLAAVMATLAGLFAFASASTADQLADRSIQLHVAGTAGSDVIDLDAVSYAEAVAELSTGTDTVVLPVLPLGGVPTTIGVASIETRNDDAPSIAIVGQANVFGIQADVLITSTWDDAADPDGTTSVVFDLRGADLTQLVAADLPIAFSNTLVGVSLTEQTLDGEALPSSALEVLSDGSTLAPEMHFVAGVSVRALVDATNDAHAGPTDRVLAQTALDLGLDPMLRLEGSLSGDISSVFAGEPAEPTEFSIRASAQVATTAEQLPDYVAPTGSWSFSVEFDTAGALAASVEGTLGVTVGSETTDVAVTASIGYAAPEVSFALTAEVGEIDDLFGEQWLDLTGLTFDTTVSSTNGVSASLTAGLDLTDLTGTEASADVTLALDAGSGGVSGAIDIVAGDLGLGVPIPTLATGLGDVDDLLAESAELRLNEFAMSLSFDTADGFSGVAAVSSEAGFAIGDVEISGDLLLRSEFGVATEPQLLLALDADLDEASLSTLLGPDVPFDVTVEQVRLSISSSDVDIAADDLDAATAAFVGPDEGLDVPNGVVLGTAIRLEQDLVDLTGALGIESDGLLRTEIRVPLLGYTSLESSVTVQFPTLTGTGAFRSGELSLEAKQSGNSFSLKIVGTATVAVPRDQDPKCNGTDTRPADHSCEDELEFQLDAAVAASDASFGVTLGGELRVEEGWTDPTGLRGITIFGLRLEGGVELEGGLTQVKLGFRGQLRIDGLSGNRDPITVTTAFSLGIVPNPPYVIPEGFTFASDGFGLLDITTVAEVLIQEEIPAIDLPADLRLEDVFVSVSTVTNPDLCLTQGFTIQAQLHLGGAKQGDGVPTCTPENGLTLTDDCADRASCIAAVSIDAQTSAQGTPGLRAFARLNELDLAGVITSDGIDIALTVTPTEQRLFIDGDATLSIPVDPPIQIATADVFVDFTPFSLTAEIDAELGDPDGATFGVFIRGVAQLDLTDPQFEFEVEFDTALLDEIGAAIEQGVNDVAQVLDELVVITTDDALVFNNLKALIEQRAAQGAQTPPWLTDVVTSLADAELAIEDANAVFTDIGLPPPIVITEVRDIVLNGTTIRSGGIPAIDYRLDTIASNDNDGADGCVNLHGRSADGGCYVLPPINLVIPGLCDDTGFRASATSDVLAVLCGDFSGVELATVVFEENIEPTLAAPLPTGLDASTLVGEIGPTIAGGQLAVECGGFTIDTTTNSITEPAVTMQLGSRTLLVGLDVDPFVTAGAGVVDGDDGVRAVFDEFAGVPAPTGSPCAGDSVAEIDPSAAILFEDGPGDFEPFAKVDVGTTTDVRIECASTATATVRFGDGSAPRAVDMQGATSAIVQHTWLSTSVRGFPFLPVVTCDAGRSAPGPFVEVENSRVLIDSITVAPDSVAAGGRATIDVLFTDPGDDAHTIELSTNGGPTQVVELAPRRGSQRSAQRLATFEVFVPTDITAFKVDVQVEDVSVNPADSTTDTRELIVPVVEFAPQFVSLSPFDLIDGEPSATDPVVAQEGRPATWRLLVNDPNLTDVVTAVVTFDDGTTATVELSGGDAATVSRDGEATGTFPVANAAERSGFFDRTEASSGSKVWTVELTDSTGRSTTTDANVEVAGVAPEITNVVMPRSVPRNSSFSVSVTAVDPGVGDELTLVAEWGDGTTSTSTSDGDGSGTYSFDVTHTYGVPVGLRFVRLTVTDGDGLSDVLLPLRLIEITPAAPSITGWDIPADVDEYDRFNLSFDVSVDPNDVYDIRLDNGVGGFGLRPQVAIPTGTATLQFLELYQDDGTYTLTATITGRASGLTATETRTVTVGNLDPFFESPADGEQRTVRLGEEFTLGIRYSDRGIQDTHSVSVDWGDGSTSGPTEFINLRASNRQVVGFGHTYLESRDEPYVARVTLVDDDGGTVTYEVLYTVIDPAPSITGFELVDSQLGEGAGGTVTVTFADPSTDDAHTVDIDWGDGSSTSQAIEPGTTTIDHTWSNDGEYDVVATVTDASGKNDTATITATVANVAPVWTSIDVADTADEGASVTLSTTFSDPGTNDTHRVTIDWGDGSSTLVIEGAPNDIEVSHVYADDDTYSVSLTVADELSGPISTSVDITVANVAPTVAATLDSGSIVEGDAVSLDIDVGDASPVDTHSVTIDWGDGWSDIERFTDLAIAPGGRSVTIDRSFGDDGAFDIVVTVADDDGATVSTTRTLVVVNATPTGAITAADELLIGSIDEPVTLEAIAHDLGSDDVTFEWTVDGVVVASNTSFANVDEGVDGTPSPQVSPRIGLTDAFALDSDGPCRYDVSLRLLDDDGGVTELGARTVLLLGTNGGSALDADEWRDEFRAGADTDEIGCLAGIIEELSDVLDGSELLDVDDRGVPTLLSNAPANGTKLAREQRRLDTELLVTFLNVADGRLSLDTPVEDSTLATVLAEVESIRATSTDWKEVRDSAQRVRQTR